MLLWTFLYKHLNTCFNFCWVHTQKWNCWSYNCMLNSLQMTRLSHWACAHAFLVYINSLCFSFHSVLLILSPKLQSVRSPVVLHVPLDPDFFCLTAVSMVKSPHLIYLMVGSQQLPPPCPSSQIAVIQVLLGLFRICGGRGYRKKFVGSWDVYISTSRSSACVNWQASASEHF